MREIVSGYLSGLFLRVKEKLGKKLDEWLDK